MYKQNFERIWVTNRILSDDFYDDILTVLKSGIVSKILLREADLDEGLYVDLAKYLCELAKPFNTEIILHSYFGVANKLGVRNLHLSFDRFLKFKSSFSGDFSGKVGVSIHSADDAVKAQNLGANYLVAGHIFDTPSHSDESGRGVEFLRRIVENAKIPVYAIGGINSQNIELVRDSGACGAYMMREILKIIKDKSE